VLLDILRSAFLDEAERAAHHLSAREVIGVLRAFERVRGELAAPAAAFRAPADDAAPTNGGSRPDALNLLIEVAHDMRSPLASILFLSDALQRGQSGSLSDVQGRQVRLIYSAAFGLSAIASDVVELVRADAPLLEPHPVPFSVGEVLQGVYDMVLPIAEEKGLALGLVPPDTDYRLGQPAPLSRVLLNLMSNALRHTARGAVSLVTRQPSRTSVEFCVSDTGSGIPPEVMAHLFQPLRLRPRPGQHVFSSTGLGLSICHRLVRVMGGELRVETSPTTGTRVSFVLQLPPAAED
jgi:signal transduction histidine kinase